MTNYQLVDILPTKSQLSAIGRSRRAMEELEHKIRVELLFISVCTGIESAARRGENSYTVEEYERYGAEPYFRQFGGVVTVELMTPLLPIINAAAGYTAKLVPGDKVALVVEWTNKSTEFSK